jgi:hypothetical protein
MNAERRRFTWVTALTGFMLHATLVFLGLLVIGTVAVTVELLLGYEVYRQAGQVPHSRWLVLAGGLLAALLELVVAGWVLVGAGLVRVIVRNAEAVVSAAGRLQRIESVLEDQNAGVKELAALAPLSDQAKAMIFRDREIEALREIVHADLMRQDYDTAERLLDTVADRFGYADEAERLRAEVAESRQATMAEKLDKAVVRVQQIMDRHDWGRALRESQRIARLFPDSAKAAGLTRRVEEARAAHKRALLQNYAEAVRRNDVDRGIQLLKELDLYLTPQEAAALQESARGVFRAKLHNLGVQFAIHVTDERWAEAVTTGEEIVNEFPNSRMAEEVRQKMGLLRSRAEGGQDEANASS